VDSEAGRGVFERLAIRVEAGRNRDIRIGHSTNARSAVNILSLEVSQDGGAMDLEGSGDLVHGGTRDVLVGHLLHLFS
jgi:hypothetical protein